MYCPSFMMLCNGLFIGENEAINFGVINTLQHALKQKKS